MQFIKENKVLKEYLLPFVLLPIICMFLEPVIMFIFKLGAYQGTFFRAIFELVLNSL